jgi:hypothetical protein
MKKSFLAIQVVVTARLTRRGFPTDVICMILDMAFPDVVVLDCPDMPRAFLQNPCSDCQREALVRDDGERCFHCRQIICTSCVDRGNVCMTCPPCSHPEEILAAIMNGQEVVFCRTNRFQVFSVDGSIQVIYRDDLIIFHREDDKMILGRPTFFDGCDFELHLEYSQTSLGHHRLEGKSICTNCVDDDNCRYTHDINLEF